jgi:hypothetical protein
MGQGDTMEAVLKTVLATPRARLQAGVTAVGQYRRLPAWSHSLADGDPQVMEQLVGKPVPTSPRR